MSLVVNNNMMAANTARNLNAHYGRLATSTQRLSSGLRINSAADDAAGLAIRELQRADIAALHQGARNANDAISMIQVADGSLGIIDEKLIRMKELAEQAATGTYDSTQRLMIESEYQAMASEITRIANATDFNGTKLLDGTLAGDHDGSGLVSEGKMKIHFGTGNDSAEDYYYVEIGECTSEALGLGNNSTWKDVQTRALNAFADSLKKSIKESGLPAEEQGNLLNQIGSLQPDGTYSGAMGALNEALANATDYKQAFKYFTEEDLEKYWPGNSDLMAEYMAAASKDANPDNIYKQYLLEKGLQTSITDAKLNDTAAWTAAAATAQSTDEQAIYQQYLIDNGLTLEEAKADATGWTTAKGNATVTVTADEIYAEFVKSFDDIDTAKANTTDWGTATTAAQALHGAGATEDQIYEQYLLAKGWHPTADDAAANNNTAWTAATTAAQNAKRANLSDAEIYAQYLIDKKADTPATIQGNDAAGWTTAANNAATDEDIFKEYLTIGGAELSAEAAEKNDTAAWNAAAAKTNAGELDDFWNNLRETQRQKLQYAWGQAAIAKLAGGASITDYGVAADFDFGQPDMIKTALEAMQKKVGHMDFAGHTIETQEDAQMALTAINNAIVSKDKIRAHLGAAQNRLENTVSNLNIQAENLQAAESRISDVDVATEMTQFVRNQILTQSAVAMLSQANSLPQMAMQLIGG